MGNKRLHNLDISEDALERRSNDISRQIQKQGVVTDGPSSVESIATDPNELTLAGEFRGREDDLDTIMAAEVEDLFDAGGIEEVAYHDVANPDAADGYYTAENVSTSAPDPRLTDSTAFDGRLTRVGTRADYHRAVQTASTTVGSPFGSGTPHVAVPSTGRMTQWVDRVSGDSVWATPATTVTTEFGDVDLYTPSASPYDQTELVYDVPYSDDGGLDVRVWDDYNRPLQATAGTGSKTFGGNTFGGDTFGGETTEQEILVGTRWRQVFRTNHQFVGKAILETGRLQLVCDETGDRLAAGRWDSDDSHYARVELPNSDWRLFDLDIRRIGAARIDAQLAFSQRASNGIETVQVSLQRGLDGALIWRRDGLDPLPTGLQERLDPIALAKDVDLSPTKTLRATTEVA